MNPKKLPQAVSIHLVFKPFVVEEKTKSGIILPSDKLEKDQYAMNIGTIINKGKAAFADWMEEGKEVPGVGDTIYTSRYPGLKFEFEGEPYFLINDHHVLGIIEKGEAA